MQHRNFFQIAGIIFFLAFLLHGYRSVTGLDLLYGDYLIPMWISWFVTVLAAWMALSAWKMK